MKISCAVSPCPNDVFIFSGLITGEVKVPGLEWEFRFEDIETLNRMALAGAPGLIKVSAALVGRLPGYRVLSSGGALGRGCGPLLLGHRPALDESRPLLLPGRHTTAHFLCHFFLTEELLQGKRLHRKVVEKKFMPFDALYRHLVDHSDSQGVVIHESRFTYERDGLTCIRDLGAYWEETTGYPIPLGVIVSGTERQGVASSGLSARASTKGERHSESPGRRLSGSTVGKSPTGLNDFQTQRSLPGEFTGNLETGPEQLSDAVRRSLEWAYRHKEKALDLCRQHAQEMEDSVMKAHIDLYVNDYSLDMGEEGRRALDFILSRRPVI